MNTSFEMSLPNSSVVVRQPYSNTLGITVIDAIDTVAYIELTVEEARLLATKLCELAHLAKE